MINLLEETKNIFTKYSYTEEDVTFCEVTRSCWKDGKHFKRTFQFPFSVFKKNANFNYDDGYGSEKVNTSLKIVFNDGAWIERDNYDGAEWWRYNKCPSFNTFDNLKKIDLHNRYDDDDYKDDISKIFKEID